MRPPRARKDGETGSVLVEALVAIAIVAMMLAAAYGVIGHSALRAHAAESARTAGLIARSQLAAIGAETPLEIGQSDGADGAFVWHVEIEPAEASGPAATGRLLQVRVVVRDRVGGAERARLTTLRAVAGG